MDLSSCSNGVPTVVLVLLFLSSTVLCDCPTPTLPPYSRQRGSVPLKESYLVGFVMQLVCIPGYEVIPGKHPYLVCNRDEKWIELTELCQGKRCPVPRLENGRIESPGDFRLGDRVTLACNTGFRIVGESVLRCILKGGKVDWHKDIPFCEYIPCARPDMIPNGRYDPDPGDLYVVGTLIIYRCDAGYSRIGNSTITCIAAADGKNGQWDLPPPECKKVSCAQPNIRNGRTEIYTPNYTYRDRVTIECNPGYTLVGSSLVTCDADNMWKPSLPRCDKIAITTKPTRPTPVPSVVPPVVPPIVPPPPPVPPPIPPTTIVPPGETTFIPMFPTRRETITTVESDPPLGSGSGKIVGIVFGIIVGLIVLAALIFAALRRRKQRKANAPGNGQVASEKGQTMGHDQTSQQFRSNIQRFSALELKTGTP